MTEEDDITKRLRVKERKTYLDEGIDDDDIEGKREFNLEDKLKSKSYNGKFVKQMTGSELNYKYIQENGFVQPFVIYDKTGLGMRMVSTNFKVNDVKQCVGSRRMIDVVDVNTQKGTEMSMKDWVKYYESKDKDRLLNVISLEFSQTRLENYVECPTLVRQLDWVECAWPKHLKNCQTESTNVLEKMKYPKVQKYCLMSVKGCYTDFHIDFGGTSVWYHLLHGSKIFWMIPPTEKNLELYENWVLSGKQGDVFFADQVEKCERITLEAGYTFLIPTGWIHAVYTPVDSLVFGGNFIHSFNIVKQLSICQTEDSTHVPQKFRYPFYGEMLWYVIERYVLTLTGITFLNKSHLTHQDSESESELKSDKVKVKHEMDNESPNDSTRDCDMSSRDVSPPLSPVLDEHNYVQSPNRSPRSPPTVKRPSSPNQMLKALASVATDIMDKEAVISRPAYVKKKDGVHLTRLELEGLGALVDYLDDLPESKKCVPHMILEPHRLLEACKTMLIVHSDDDQQRALTGKPVFSWPSEAYPQYKVFHPKPQKQKTVKSTKKGQSSTSGMRRRRTRCKNCEPCTRKDCGECHFCKDMKKFGGSGRMKQCCLSKRCLAPVLPLTSTCMICDCKSDPSEEDNILMECGICWEILHPECLREKYENINLEEAQINEDLPNSWECPKCCRDGKQGQLKPRTVKGIGLLKRSDSRTTSTESNDTTDVFDATKKTKPEGKQPIKDEETSEKEEEDKMPNKKKRKASEPTLSPTKQPKVVRSVTPTRQPEESKADHEQTSSRTSKRPSRETEEDKPVVKKKRGRKKKIVVTPLGDNSTVSPSLRKSPRRGGDSCSLKEKLKGLKVMVQRHVVRPAPLPPMEIFMSTPSGERHPIEQKIWLRVFSYLSQADLSRCMCVCKNWTQWCCSRVYWNYIDLNHTKIKQAHLMGIVRRQPGGLSLASTNISRKQLTWLLPRLPQMKQLNLDSSSWSAASALCTASCPFLNTLSLNWVAGVNDDSIEELVSPPGDHRPGQQNASRIRQITRLEISGSDITDDGVSLIIGAMPKLSRLSLSHCGKITNSSIQALTKTGSNTRDNLVYIDMTSCSKLTSDCVDMFKKCKKLEHINFQACSKVSKVGCQRFVESSRGKYKLLKDKLIGKC